MTVLPMTRSSSICAARCRVQVRGTRPVSTGATQQAPGFPARGLPSALPANASKLATRQEGAKSFCCCVFFCEFFPPFRERHPVGARGPGAAKRVRACEGMGILLSKIFGKLIGQKEVLGCPCRARLLTSLHAAGSALATGRGPGVAAAGHRSRCCPWPERASHRQQRLMLALVAVHSVLARCGF